LIFFSIPFFKFQKPAVKKTFEKFQSLVLIKVFLFILTDKSLTWKQNSVFKSKLKDVDVLLVHKIIYRHIIIYSFLKGRYTLCIMIIQLEVAFVQEPHIQIARSTDVMGVLNSGIFSFRLGRSFQGGLESAFSFSCRRQWNNLRQFRRSSFFNHGARRAPCMSAVASASFKFSSNVGMSNWYYEAFFHTAILTHQNLTTIKLHTYRESRLLEISKAERPPDYFRAI
jgi:hypothetical protein